MKHSKQSQAHLAIKPAVISQKNVSPEGGVNASQPLIHSHTLWPQVNTNWSLTCCSPLLTGIGFLEDEHSRICLKSIGGKKGPRGFPERI